MVAQLLHGHTRYGGIKRNSPTYNTWVGMKRRCTQEDHHNWEHYGGRGISYDPEWEDFENFLSDMGDRPEGMTLDRIDSDGDYCKDNCRWATITQQLRNRRNTVMVSYMGRYQSLQDWCEELDLSYSTTHKRLFKYGYTTEEAFTKPVR
jgi:hypothetical protein